jgi:hypothetical protein
MGQVARDADRISFRWGIPELDHGNVMIPEPILRYHGRLGVKANQFILIIQLATFKYESAGGEARPSFSTIAERMGVTRRYVIDLVTQLEEEGWLAVSRRGTQTNVYSFEKFAQECWALYLAELVNHSSPDTSELVNCSSPELVNHSSPEEEESKNKKEYPSSAKPRAKVSRETMTRLTEGFAERQGYRPDGDRWKPIQQGYRLIIAAGYTVEQIEACENRLVELGWTWTINTVRDWLPRFVAGKMVVDRKSAIADKTSADEADEEQAAQYRRCLSAARQCAAGICVERSRETLTEEDRQKIADLQAAQQRHEERAADIKARLEARGVVVDEKERVR